MNYCPECRTMYFENAIFCHGCGAKRVLNSSKSTNQNKECNDKSINDIRNFRLFCLTVRHFLWYELFGEEDEKLQTKSQIQNFLDSFSETSTQQFSIEKKELVGLSYNEDLIKLIKEYMNRYAIGEYNLFLHNVKETNVSLKDIIDDEGFFLIVKMIYDKTRFHTEKLKKEEITKLIILNMNTVGKASYEYEREDSINQLKVQILLSMNNNGTIVPLLEKYLNKYINGDFRHKVFEQKSGFSFDKDDLIDIAEAIVDFTSPTSAVKRVLGLLRD